MFLKLYQITIQNFMILILSGNGHFVGTMMKGNERNETGKFIQEDCPGK